MIVLCWLTLLLGRWSGEQAGYEAGRQEAQQEAEKAIEKKTGISILQWKYLQDEYDKKHKKNLEKVKNATQ